MGDPFSKLIEWYETGECELYDLGKDIGEENNLAAKKPEKARALQEKLREWRKKVDAPL